MAETTVPAMMRVALPIDLHGLDDFIAAAIEAKQREVVARAAADEGFRAVTEEWRRRWEARQEGGI
jgi:hypothetical protein